MKNQKLITINIELNSRKNILEKITLYMANSGQFFHIVSINPEIIVQASKNELFSKVLSQGDIQLCDGVGVLLGCSILGIPVQNRISGVDFMEEVLHTFHNRSLRVLIIGGKENLAEKVANCYQKTYPSSKFKGMQAIHDINNPTQEEIEEFYSIVADYKPQILFSAFGSPQQELFFWQHKDKLKGVICMGVGGGLDFVGGEVRRAPKWIRAIGLEWLFRLIIEPWRWKRQLRLIEFMYLVFKQKFGLL